MNVQVSPPDVKPMRDLSYSSAKEVHSCARKYQIRKLFTQPRHIWEDSLAANGGTAVHEYIQTRLSTGSKDQARMAFFYAFNFVSEDAATPLQQEQRGFEACLHTVEELYDSFNLDTAQLAQFSINGELRPAIEVKFEIVFRNPNWSCDYRYRGAIDTVLFDSFRKRYRAIDFKTQRDYKAMSADSQEHKFKWDSQLVPYGLVIEHLSGNSADEHLVYDTEYFSIFIDLLEPDFRSYPFKRDIEDVRAWHDSVLEMIGRMESYHDRLVWPRTFSGCEAWGRPCKFYKNCHIEDPDELQERLLNFGRWEPAPPHEFKPWVTLYIDC